MNWFTKIGIGFSLMLALVACKDDDEFSNTPELFFRDFQEPSDTIAIWSLGFTDGDGDIGVRNDNDSDNFIVSIYRIDDGIETLLPSTVNYRIPVVRNIVTSNGIEGEFKFTIEKRAYLIFGIDSMYMSGYVLDRSNKLSNTVRTPVFKTN